MISDIERFINRNSTHIVLSDRLGNMHAAHFDSSTFILVLQYKKDTFHFANEERNANFFGMF